MGNNLRKGPLLQNEKNDLYCIDILYKSLQEFHIPEYLCSVGEYAEESICLENTGSNWIVYGGERGQKHDLKTHADCQEACLDIISRITETTEDEKNACDFFNRELNKKNRFILSTMGTKESEQKVRAAFR